MSKFIHRLSQQEKLNFLLTNRVPRRLLTQWMGWFSKIENKWLTKMTIAVWKVFVDDLNLSEAKKTCFVSLQDCFIRELKPGARPVDGRIEIVTSPCDAIIGACGVIEGGTVYQAKGYPYEISELIPDRSLQQRYHDGVYATLRLKSSMYHRFHAPIDCHVKKINYISGDTWNVNPISLKRIEKLFCKNERAVVELHPEKIRGSITLVPVAAILVACMRFHCLDDELDFSYRGPNHIPCDASYKKGEEMGYFQHGSTIILFASADFQLCNGLKPGDRIDTGQALLTAA